MASHFRSAERQGSEDESREFVSVPDEASQATAASPEDTGAFLAAGGKGIEVTSGSQSAEANVHYAQVARDRKLLASTGSDWHSDRSPRPRPGCQPPLPPDLTPVWTLFGYA